ncbi:MAG: type II secretion system F family protein [Candidatus Latescibacteria bacterium]|nr:type II secretion system F family protein [Candidatus Latescibacterota bacterium]NIM21008.1 type II secretion system F family protein [Candidatus Latescibacterota bacterium]NIM65143.1 type II secretion system F family protein [Candidatus Latescibacterota bacterium]NIO01658.1 type II secretion system F family protein [Candidatus Latescibacterota bacterium]NIO28175.1 type II secretion system F family protein [Candidatus Latescibacterota bacterium]
MATTYLWKGRSPDGEILSGEYVTDNKQELVTYLRKRKIIITSLKEKSKEINIPLPFLRKRITVKDMGVFTRQFATMINSGLPMVQCLEILSAQMDKENFRKISDTVKTDVEGGATLADALRKHSIFSDLYVNMVEAGEAGGILDLILNRLALYLEKADALARKVKSALMYPTVVCVVAIGATVFMLMFIIPTFARMFADFGGDLPLPTKVVLAMSNFLRTKWFLLIGGAIALVVGFKRAYATDTGKMKIDAFMLKIPVLGIVLRKAAVARFTRTLGTLVSSGVPILSGLEITARTAGNKVVEKAVNSTRESISQGNTIADPLKGCGVFPPMVTQMIAVGEQTGALDEMLEKIANFYDDEVDTAVESLTSIIEPVMIVVMGVIVGGMLISMYLPMFKLINVIAGS